MSRGPLTYKLSLLNTQRTVVVEPSLALHNKPIKTIFFHNQPEKLSQIPKTARKVSKLVVEYLVAPSPNNTK